jgi:hypothetical protein
VKHSGILLAELLVANVLCGPAAWSQTDASHQQIPEIEVLADRARALPVEFRADVLFRLVDAGNIHDRKSERAILEDLFSAASQAQYPIAMFDVGTSTDTRSWALASGFQLGLDTLSIRCRVVRKMLALDPQRARELFVLIGAPVTPDPACVDSLVSNVEIWFDTLREVVDRSFSDSEREQDLAIQFFEPYIRSLPSSLQLPAAARAVRTARATLAQRQKLVNLLAATIGELKDGDRGFTFAIRRLDFAGELVKLGQEIREQGGSADNLIGAYRSFLVTHITGERCADSVPSLPAQREEAVRVFNERLRWAGYLASADLKAISEEESRSAKIGIRAKIVPYWQSAQSKRLLSVIRHLRFGETSRALSEEQKHSVGWQNEVRQFLADLANWNPEDELSAADYFNERAILYRSLIDLIPEGALRDGVVQSCMSFLSQNPIKMDSPIQFLTHLNAIFQLTDASHGNSDAMMQALLNSKDAIISLYANVERVAPVTRVQ